MKTLTSIIIALLLTACGGGTSGTGNILIEGKVLRSDGSAIGDAVVSILETGDTATTDVNGDFVIQTSPNSENSLLIESGSINTVVQVGPTSENNTRVRVSIEIEAGTNSGKVVSIEIEDRSDDDDSESGSGSNREEIKICGVIQSISSGQVTINGVSYELAPGTEFENDAGAKISVADFLVGETVELTIRNGQTHELEKEDEPDCSEDRNEDDDSDDKDSDDDEDDSEEEDDDSDDDEDDSDDDDETEEEDD